MAFTYEGKNPSMGLYRELGSIGEFEGVDWKIFCRPGQNKVYMVLVAQGRAKSKANYRDLVWDGVRLAPYKDENLLKTHRGTMHSALLGYLRENVPVDSELLTSLSGRSREGVVPPSEEWTKVGDVTCEALNTWSVYRKNLDWEADWVPLKVVAQMPVPNKANYYMKWNGERLSGEKDAILLAEHRPDLCDAIVEKLRECRVSGRAKEHAGEQQTVNYVNLGPVGTVSGSARDLLLVEDLSNPDVAEAWLTTKTPNVVTAISFRVKREEDTLFFEGPLYNSLRHTPDACTKVEELLKQYFLEKDFY